MNSAANDQPTSIPAMAPLSGNANVLASGVPQIPAELRARLGQYLNARTATLFDVAPDGKQALIGTRFANTVQVHLVGKPLEGRVADRRQITFFDEPVASAKFARTADGGDAQSSAPLYFLQDVGGGEAYQIYQLERRTGRARMLTDGKTRHGSLLLSRNGRRAAFTSTARNGKDTDVYLIELNPDVARDDATSAGANWTTSARRLTEEAGTWAPVDFSADGKRVLVEQYRAIDDAELWMIDADSGKRSRLTPTAGKGSVGAAAFDRTGRSVLLATDRYSDFNELYQVPLNAAGDAPAANINAQDYRPVPLSSGIKWNVEGLEVAADRDLVAFAINEDGLSKLCLLSPQGSGTAAGAESDMSKWKRDFHALPEPGVIGNMLFARSNSRRLFVSADTSRSPSDVFCLELPESSDAKEKWSRWTQSEIGGLDPSVFVTPELVRYPSAGGFQIPAFVYRPAASATAGKHPVLVVWHGGPEGQSRPGFAALLQYLVNELEIAVIMPNVRGSDGYGKAFLAADDGVKRKDSLQDIGATLDWIATQPDMDTSRIGVYGGSYGGYMVLASATFFPERIKAAVDVVGISSIPTFLNNTQAYRRDLRRREYGDERDPAVRTVQEEISPLLHVEKIQCALFVQQGKNDPRVPQSEAEQIVTAVRKKAGGSPDACWYFLALDEGHGFFKKANRDLAYQSLALFLRKHLIGEPAQQVSARKN